MVIGVFYQETMEKGFFRSGSGSDSYIILDGRKNIRNLIADMNKIENRMDNIRKVNHKYSIIQGYDFKDCLNKIDKKGFIYSTMELDTIKEIA